MIQSLNPAARRMVGQSVSSRLRSAAGALAIAAFVLASGACGTRDSTIGHEAPTAESSRVTQVRQPPLNPLDESTSAGFRRAFDEPGDRTRFIVALSPT